MDLSKNNNFVSCLDLCEAFVKKYAIPAMKEDYPELFAQSALGLAGNGSECFGYDDEMSADHDWGLDFFIWLPEEKRELTDRLSQWKSRLIAEKGTDYPTRSGSKYGTRCAVMTCGEFYKSLTGCEKGPRTNKQWLAVPEELLAIAVNGRVFHDGRGEFSETRAHISRYYPDDVWLKRLSVDCYILAQTGQYNLLRCLKRGEILAAGECRSRFITAAAKMVCHLNRVYSPYYKWLYRRASEQPVLAGEILAAMEKLAHTEISLENDELFCLTEQICISIAGELRKQGLSESDESFLAAHGEYISSGIKDAEIRVLPPLV